MAVIYILSSLFAWGQSYIMAGVTQRTVYRMRRDVDAKLSRLPLSYFDSHPRGDTLSRVTNDIDNIANSLQQTLTQLITALCTIIGVIAIMFWISPLLAVISLLTVPLSIAVTVFIAKRSSEQFAAQWTQTGKLNGHVEEMHTGHSASSRRSAASRRRSRPSTQENEQLFQASFKAQFLSGTIQPIMAFIANLNYVAICVIGGIQVANGQMSLGDVQAFVQYSRQFTMPITQTASIANVIQSAIASAERVFELLDEGEESREVELVGARPAVAGRVELENVSFRYLPEVPLIEDLNLVVEPGQMVAIVGPTGAGKTTLVNLLMRFYEIDERPDHDRRHRQPRDVARRAAVDVRDGPPGHVAVPRHDPREHRLRPRGRRPRRRSSRPPRPPTSTTSCGRCPTATTRSSTTTRPTCRRARSSC